MLAFCGFDECVIDGSGRIKLSPRAIEDFRNKGGDIVLRCLPEGAVAVYPEEIYLQMRRAEEHPVERAAESFVMRQKLRMFGGLTEPERISPQGRITVPPKFREFADLASGAAAVVVGVEIGVEIWNRSRWDEEQRKYMEHNLEKREREMSSDLDASGKQPEAGGENV